MNVLAALLAPLGSQIDNLIIGLNGLTEQVSNMQTQINGLDSRIFALESSSSTPPSTPPVTLFQEVINILGSTTSVILPLRDSEAGGFDVTTFTTVGAEQLTFTWPEAPNNFGIPPTAQGNVPVLTFNGTDIDASTPDSDFWSRGDGNNDFAFSVGMWTNFDFPTSSELMSKWTAGAPEWTIQTHDQGSIALFMIDPSTEAFAGGIAGSAVTQDGWHFFVITYDGRGGLNAGSGIRIYKDGSILPRFVDGNSGYVAMENLGGSVHLGSRGGTAGFLNGKVAGDIIGPFFTQKKLILSEVTALYEIGRTALGLP